MFLVGQSPDAARDYEKEWRVGGFLAQRLRDVVPEPRWYAEPGADFPYGALGYRKLPGRTPVWGAEIGAQFAASLGTFMARLHAIPVDEARTAGVAEVNSYRRLLGARDVVMPVLAARLMSAELTRVESWWDTMAADERMKAGSLGVCHHDLWHDNLLWESGRLSGVLDLAHVEIGDPAQDFAAPRYFGDARFAEIVQAYRRAGGEFDDETAHRAQCYFEGREFGGLAWAIEHDNAAEVESAVDKILRGPILSSKRDR